MERRPLAIAVALALGLLAFVVVRLSSSTGGGSAAESAPVAAEGPDSGRAALRAPETSASRSAAKELVEPTIDVEPLEVAIADDAPAPPRLRVHTVSGETYGVEDVSVLDRTTPLGGVRVRVSAGAGAVPARDVLSDSTGLVEIDDLEPGHYSVEVEFSAPSPLRVRDLTLQEGTTHELVFAAGQVHDVGLGVWTYTPDGGYRPLEAAAVRVVVATGASAQWLHPGELARAPLHVTDHEGLVSVPIERGRAHLLRVSATGYLSADVRFDLNPFLSDTPFSNDGRIHVLLVPAERSIDGQLVLRGEPCDDGLVAWVPRGGRDLPWTGVPTDSGEARVRPRPHPSPPARCDANGEWQLLVPHADTIPQLGGTLAVGHGFVRLADVQLSDDARSASHDFELLDLMLVIE